MTKNANILLVGQSTIEENDGNMIFVNGDVLLYRQNKDGVEIEDYTIVVYGKER